MKNISQNQDLNSLSDFGQDDKTILGKKINTSNDLLVQKLIDLKLPLQWKEVIDCQLEIQKERQLKATIKNIVGESKPISIDTFEKALKKFMNLKEWMKKE